MALLLNAVVAAHVVTTFFFVFCFFMSMLLLLLRFVVVCCQMFFINWCLYLTLLFALWQLEDTLPEFDKFEVSDKSLVVYLNAVRFSIILKLLQIILKLLHCENLHLLNLPLLSGEAYIRGTYFRVEIRVSTNFCKKKMTFEQHMLIRGKWQVSRAQSQYTQWLRKTRHILPRPQAPVSFQLTR